MIMMRIVEGRSRLWALFSVATLVLCLVGQASGENPEICNQLGLRMSIAKADRDPAIHVVVPGGPEAERSFDILFPEHATVRERGRSEAQYLYIYQPAPAEMIPEWKQVGNTLEYTKLLSGIKFSARATLESDGILFHYEFENLSEIDYDMALAVTDPRFKTIFYDPRLERTYVHHSEGFELLASETPTRLTMPPAQWFPLRYHAQLTAPVPQERVQHRGDGITYYYKSHAADIPMIATLSVDRKWIAASFTQRTWNVWSNPELTCQHVDPQVALPKGKRAFYEIKILIFPGTLEQAREKVLKEQLELKSSSLVQ